MNFNFIDGKKRAFHFRLNNFEQYEITFLIFFNNNFLGFKLICISIWWTRKKLFSFFLCNFPKIPNISVNAVFDLKETIKLNKNDAENIKNWPKKNEKILT